MLKLAVYFFLESTQMEFMEVMMNIQCVWEHNGDDTLLYSDSVVGAFARGESREAALKKMPSEIRSFLRWKGADVADTFDFEIVQEKSSDLTICDADSDVFF